MAHEASAGRPAAMRGAAMEFAEAQDSLAATYGALEMMSHSNARTPGRAAGEAASGQRDLFLHELNHRLKNSLQSLLSYLSLRTRQAKRRDVREALSDIRKQVIAIAVVHEEISAAATLEADALLRRIVTHLRSIADSARRIDLEFDLASVMIDARLASSLGMIAAELVWNSYKHAFPRRQRGVIAVSLAATPGEIVLVVRDTGPGQKKASMRAGTGLAMVRRIAAQHNGRMVVEPRTAAGTCVTVTVARAGTF